MNPDELMAMLREANAAVREGADPNVIGRMIAEETGGAITSLSNLGKAVQAAQAEDSPTVAAQKRMSARGGSAVGDFARMAAQGATFGFADEIVGAVAGDEAKEASRQRVADLRQLAPGASTMAEIAGGVAAPFMTGAGVARALTRPGAGIVARGLAAGAGGAVGGGAGAALYGAGEAEGGIGPRAIGAAASAPIGAAGGFLTGGALSLLGSTLSRSGRFGGEVIAPESQGKREASRRLRQVFEEAEIDPASVPQRMDELGPNAVIADLDPRLGREARNAVNQAPALERAGGPVDALRARTEARGERLIKAMRETSGISESMQAGQEAARRAVQEVREQHYQPLEAAFPEVTGQGVQQALTDPRVARVARRTAQDIVADEGAIARAVKQGVPEADARQVVAPKRAPSFTELQDIMMDLRDEVTAARIAGRPNRSRRAAEALDIITSAMEQDIPGFSEAQGAFRIASKTLEAYDEGFTAWTKSAREIQEAMQELPPEAHDAFRVGLLQRWQEKLLEKEGTTGTVNSLLRAGDEMRGQIRAAFGDEDALGEFLRQSDLERTFRLTEAAVQGNSTTAQQALDAMDSAPMSKSELFNRIYDALLSPGESRRVQSQIVGQQLLGSNVESLSRAIRPSPIGLNTPGAAGGMGAAAGIAADRIINPTGRNPLADLVSRLGGR